MPNIDANIPDVNLPDVDLSLADVDVNLPEIDLSLTPSWYSYLQDNDFQNNNTDYSEFDSDEVLTRSSVTPYLWRYAQINGITQDSTADCSFPDIADVVNALQISIKTVCEYGLLR